MTTVKDELEKREVLMHHRPPTICEICSENYKDSPCEWQIFEKIHACAHQKADSKMQLARLRSWLNDIQHGLLVGEEADDQLENPFTTIFEALDRKDELEEFEEVAGRLSDVNANLLEELTTAKQRIAELEPALFAAKEARDTWNRIAEEREQDLTKSRQQVELNERILAKVEPIIESRGRTLVDIEAEVLGEWLDKQSDDQEGA